MLRNFKVLSSVKVPTSQSSIVKFFALLTSLFHWSSDSKLNVYNVKNNRMQKN